MRAKGHEMGEKLKDAGVRVVVDLREDKNPGWKYAHWEQKGVCIRVELGPRDMENKTVVLARRDIPGKEGKAECKWDDLVPTVTGLLSTIQKDMLQRATAQRDSQLSRVYKFDDFIPALDKKHIVLAPWCNTIHCEETVKDRTGPTKEEAAALAAATGDAEEAKKKLTGAAKTLCIPHKQDPLPAGTYCFACAKMATTWCLWGRSY